MKQDWDNFSNCTECNDELEDRLQRYTGLCLDCNYEELMGYKFKDKYPDAFKEHQEMEIEYPDKEEGLNKWLR